MKEFNLKVTFTDRESYLSWRKQWAADYRDISQTITDLKFCRKTEITEAQAARQKEIMARPHLRGKYGFNLYGELWRHQDKARTYMALLDAAKDQANKQWEAQHPDLVVAARMKRAQDNVDKTARRQQKMALAKEQREARRAAFKRPATASDARPIRQT